MVVKLNLRVLVILMVHAEKILQSQCRIRIVCAGYSGDVTPHLCHFFLTSPCMCRCISCVSLAFRYKQYCYHPLMVQTSLKVLFVRCFANCQTFPCWKSQWDIWEKSFINVNVHFQFSFDQGCYICEASDNKYDLMNQTTNTECEQ